MEDASTVLSIRDALRSFSCSALPLRLSEETAKLVGHPMPIRLDGRTLSAPNVLEPITGLQLQMVPVKESDVKAIRQAAKRACG